MSVDVLYIHENPLLKALVTFKWVKRERIDSSRFYNMLKFIFFYYNHLYSYKKSASNSKYKGDLYL